MSVKGRIVVIDDEVNAAAALEFPLFSFRIRFYSKLTTQPRAQPPHS